MQAELPNDVQIIGVNEAGLESSNESFTDGRDLPWLQDVTGLDVWTLWEVVYRDVIVLDANGAFVGVYNLTEHDLSQDGDYQALLGALTELGDGDL